MTATLSLASVLAESARRRPDALALVEDERRLTFGQVWQQVRRQAARLVELGVRPGDRVALMCPNTAEFPIAYYAILTAGGVVVPVHLLLTAREAEWVLHDSGATVMLFHPAQSTVARTAAAAAGADAVAVGERFADELATFHTRRPDDPAVILYTSGTTGRPKGAVLTHFNLVMNATVNAFDANDVRPGATVLGTLPLFHSFGQTVSMNATWRALGTLVLLPRFDPAAAIELMVRENVTMFHGVPTMYGALLDAARDAAELPSLRLCISGGAPLPASTLDRWQDAFGTPVYEGYGLSETSPTVTVNQPDFDPRAGTVGHPIWGVEVEIADPTVPDRIEILAPGVLGEVVVRGHNVFAGYLGNPAATDAVLIDGWFRTGDLGTKDTDGYVTIVDRVKDMIIRSGYNVYPTEVEEALLEHPAIAQVAVIGLPDDAKGEEVCAVVVASTATNADEIIDFARQRLASYKYPRRIEFTDRLPLGPSHKILKRELRERLIARQPLS